MDKETGIYAMKYYSAMERVNICHNMDGARRHVK
jgi:hypothetical protein